MKTRAVAISRVLEALLAVLIVTVVTLALGEVIIRVVNPPPKAQIIRPAGQSGSRSGGSFELFSDSGVPVWIQDRGRMNLDCADQHPDAGLVVFSGDSIFFGSGVDSNAVFTRRIQESIDADYGEGAWCVLNLSQPAYSYEQKLYWIDRLLATRRPVRLFLEVWPNDAGKFRMFGRSAYNFGGTDGETDRLPGFVPGPPSVTHWLFSNSRLFEYAVMTLFDNNPYSRAWLRQVWEPRVKGLEERLRGWGGTLTLVVATRLDVPFQKVDEIRNDPQPAMIDYSARASVEVLFLNRLMMQAGADYRDVRHDQCCHFNEKGHALLADIFTPIVKKAMSDREAEVRTGDR